MSDERHAFAPDLFGDACQVCGRLADSPRHLDPEPPSVRALDGDTALEAAARSRVRAGTDRHRVLLALAAVGARGLTDFELETQTGIKQTSCGKRRKELVDAGLVERTDLRRPAPSGSQAIVWCITPTGAGKARAS